MAEGGTLAWQEVLKGFVEIGVDISGIIIHILALLSDNNIPNFQVGLIQSCKGLSKLHQYVMLQSTAVAFLSRSHVLIIIFSQNLC